MVRLVLAALCLSAPVRALRAEGGTLTNAADVAAALGDQHRAVGDRFELVGRIDGKNAVVGRTLLLHDATGGTILHCLGDAPWFDRIRSGDLVRATGVTAKDHRGLNATRCEILLALSRGLTNKEIATSLGCSPRSVKDRINAICTKLGAANRTEAVTIALRKHLVKV